MPIWISTNNFIHKRLFLIKIYFFILKNPTLHFRSFSLYMVTVLMESIAGQQAGLKTISQKIIDLEEQKGEIEQEMVENEATLAQAKQKPVNHHRLTGFVIFLVARMHHSLNFSVYGITSPYITSGGTRSL